MKLRLLLCICCALLVGGCTPDKTSVVNDQSAGDKIVAALEGYKTDRGHYPDHLDELVPKYISAIKPPGYGQKKWDYNHLATPDSFGLYMWGRKAYQDGYLYNSERKQWELVENSF
jgi:hypothetical protein